MNSRALVHSLPAEDVSGEYTNKTLSPTLAYGKTPPTLRRALGGCSDIHSAVESLEALSELLCVHTQTTDVPNRHELNNIKASKGIQNGILKNLKQHDTI